MLANFAIDENETITPHLNLEHHMQIVRALWEFPTYQRFGQVRCPTLAIPARPVERASSDDQEFTGLKERGLEKARLTMRSLRVHWLPDTIHDIPLQRPAELADLLLEFAQATQ